MAHPAGAPAAAFAPSPAAATPALSATSSRRFYSLAPPRHSRKSRRCTRALQACALVAAATEGCNLGSLRLAADSALDADVRAVADGPCSLGGASAGRPPFRLRAAKVAAQSAIEASAVEDRVEAFFADGTRPESRCRATLKKRKYGATEPPPAAATKRSVAAKRSAAARRLAAAEDPAAETRTFSPQEELIRQLGDFAESQLLANRLRSHAGYFLARRALDTLEAAETQRDLPLHDGRGGAAVASGAIAEFGTQVDKASADQMTYRPGLPEDVACAGEKISWFDRPLIVGYGILRGVLAKVPTTRDNWKEVWAQFALPALCWLAPLSEVDRSFFFTWFHAQVVAQRPVVLSQAEERYFAPIMTFLSTRPGLPAVYSSDGPAKATTGPRATSSVGVLRPYILRSERCARCRNGDRGHLWNLCEAMRVYMTFIEILSGTVFSKLASRISPSSRRLLMRFGFADDATNAAWKKAITYVGNIIPQVACESLAADLRSRQNSSIPEFLTHMWELHAVPQLARAGHLAALFPQELDVLRGSWRMTMFFLAYNHTCGPSDDRGGATASNFSSP